MGGENLHRQTIFVAAYPKSGSTWLTRLLGDVLNSPTGGCMPSQDDKEVATEGQDRPGPYIIRKGHYVLIDDDTGPVVPRPHRLAWKQLTNERVVFLVRDPRDICISGAWHWRQPVEVFLDRMIKGDVARCGRWDEYLRMWFGHIYKINKWYTKYEDLFSNTFGELVGVTHHIGHLVTGGDINRTIERQSFNTRATRIDNDPQELRRNNMRKGIAGDWRNHFTREMNERIWQEFGWMMERLGYEQMANVSKTNMETGQDLVNE